MTLISVPTNDSRRLRDAFACFPSGVTAICALHGGTPIGLAASSFCAVSIAPPLISVCIQSISTTWCTLQNVPRIGVSILADAQESACQALASKEANRFVTVNWVATEHGAVLIAGAAAFFDCTIHKTFEAGDHKLVLLQVHKFEIDPLSEPLVFHRSMFRQLQVA